MQRLIELAPALNIINGPDSKVNPAPPHLQSLLQATPFYSGHFMAGWQQRLTSTPAPPAPTPPLQTIAGTLPDSLTTPPPPGENMFYCRRAGK